MGGNWNTQNKVRPGAYINTLTKAKPLGNVSDRGIVTLPLEMPWGAKESVIHLNAEIDFVAVLGYDLTEPPLLLIKEALKRAQTVLLYRLNGETKATKTEGELTITALYEGTRGNDLSVDIVADVDNPGQFMIHTRLGQQLVATAEARTAEDLTANAWVTFSGTGELTAQLGLALSGGTDGMVTTADYSKYLSAIEVETFHTMAIPKDDPVIKETVTAFIKRMRSDEGKRCQAVLANYPQADYEGIISVKNGVKLIDGTLIDKEKATAWVAGATAGAYINQSNTYSAYEGAVAVDTRYTNSQITQALEAGEIVFTEFEGQVVVEQDINTWKSFTPTKGKVLRKNRPLRVLDGIAGDINTIFMKYYLGKADNTGDGRTLFKNECVNYFNTLVGLGAITNFDSATDVTVTQGAEPDSVVVDFYVQTVDSMEKLYGRVICQ